MDRPIALRPLVGGLVASALMLTGCAESVQSSRDTTVSEHVLTSAPPPAADLPPNAFANDDAVAPRPRLSRTITLGQGGSETVYGTPTAPAQPPAVAPSEPNVTVNHITVVQQQPVYGYGFGGFGGYGYGGGRGGVARDGSSGNGNGPARSNAWAPTGWEGAGRTAAPGATPGVGGNFAPPPSFGPRQMK
ncbi:MAG: hypothetical protein JST00_35985 [Deltaproteobacteria bacterium]|nr:hypothetical protein [Deltaproteobacteria bacterium]